MTQIFSSFICEASLSYSCLHAVLHLLLQVLTAGKQLETVAGPFSWHSASAVPRRCFCLTGLCASDVPYCEYVPEPARSAAVSQGCVVPPHPLPAAPASCSYPPPAGGFGRSGSASDASPPAATPTHKNHDQKRWSKDKRKAVTPVLVLIR